MNKEQALNAFWNSFNIPAYEENSVPFEKPFPYITYQLVTDSFGGSVYASASVFYRSKSWQGVTEKAEEISRKIGMGGIMVPYDGGAVWIQRGSPFMQTMGDPDDEAVKRKVLNISAEFISAD